jgi:ubiquinone/menaquinone biosynthesis C-methylase UbiE
MQQLNVKDFFDDNAVDYKDKYNKKDVFYQHFFYERLAETTQKYNFNDKKILDIGAGTGALYDYLLDEGYQNFTFVGTDVAPNMLAQSNIPKVNRLVGNCYELTYPCSHFDYIYMLGVTTYFDRNELHKILHFIQDKLSANGKAIITFTNSKSIDNYVKMLLKIPMRLLKNKQFVLTQSFDLHLYNLKEVKAIIDSLSFCLEEVIYLNQTFFPFSRLLPSASIKMAGWLKKKIKGEEKMQYLSSDFTIVISKK